MPRRKRRQTDETDEASALYDEIQQRIEELYGPQEAEWDPVITMALIAANPDAPDKLRFDAAKEVAPYIRPKLKQIEHTGGAAMNAAPAVQIVHYSVASTGEPVQTPPIEHEPPEALEWQAKTLETTSPSDEA